MVIGEEHFSTICTALYVIDAEVAELPTVCDAQELGAGEAVPFVACVLYSTG
jgi:hypothetical protein